MEKSTDKKKNHGCQRPIFKNEGSIFDRLQCLTKKARHHLKDFMSHYKTCHKNISSIDPTHLYYRVP